MDSSLLWYALVGVSLVAYSVLDGFDLGAGIVHPFVAKEDMERRIVLNSIGPVWDGNEVWLVVAASGIIGGFPQFFTALLSGFYNEMMCLIAAFIFRATAIEFRSKGKSRLWRSSWDYVFFLSSTIITFIFGMVIGHLLHGIPISNNLEYIDPSFRFFQPYPIMVAALFIILFAAHGASYLMIKCEGELERRAKTAAKILFSSHYLLYSFLLVVTYATLNRELYFNPIVITAIFLNGLLLFWMLKRSALFSFMFSSFNIALQYIFFVSLTFPYLIYSTINPLKNSLSIYNGSSSETTLVLLIIVASVGIPLVFIYAAWIYYVFRGKVVIKDTSY